MKYSVVTVDNKRLFVTSENPRIWNSVYLTDDYDSDYLLEGMNYEGQNY